MEVGEALFLRGRLGLSVGLVLLPAIATCTSALNLPGYIRMSYFTYTFAYACFYTRDSHLHPRARRSSRWRCVRRLGLRAPRLRAVE